MLIFYSPKYKNAIFTRNNCLKETCTLQRVLINPGDKLVKPEILCNWKFFSHDMQVVHCNGEDLIILPTVRTSEKLVYLEINAIGTDGTVKWTKRVAERNSLVRLHVLNCPFNKTIVVATDNAFTVVSWTGEVVASAQVVRVNGVSRKISSLAVYEDTIVIGLVDGRFCLYRKEDL